MWAARNPPRAPPPLPHPQVFVKGEFVGGADILISMHESGELETLLKPIREQQAHK